MRFQSFFMLMTTQPFCFASAISASLNVPIFDSTPQGFKSNALSFFAAVPNWPSW